MTNHQHRIAVDTLKLSKVGAQVLGGMSHPEAIVFLSEHGTSPASIRRRLTAAGWSANEIAELMDEASKLEKTR